MKDTVKKLSIIDVDMHFNEPPGTWDEIAPEFEQSVLRIGADTVGRRWLFAGQRRVIPLRATFPGEVDEAREAVKADPLGYEKIVQSRRATTESSAWRPAHPAESDSVERLKVLDEMGVEAALLFPSLGLFWPSVIEDEELADDNFAAWNNWVARQSSLNPARLFAAAQYSLSNVDRAVAEVRRCHALGCRGFFLRGVPYRGLPWGDPSNDPFWHALEETGMPLLIHSAPLGSLAIDPAWEKGLVAGHKGQTLQTLLNRARPPEAAISNLIFEGVLERHPALRIGVIEFGSVWVASFLQQIDYTFEFLGPRNRYMRERLRARPSDYFRRQVKVSSFWSEPLPWLLAAAGAELFMFASDFPHPEGNENAVERAFQVLAEMPPESVEKFFYGNARELFGLQPKADSDKQNLTA
ncbi:MAG: amidohydrolase [Acidobacteria bacterium]|nr:amidohydrolase [Acidobacteriota bacterium]